MIKLKQKQDILIMFFRDGKSQRAIPRETGVSRKTISKYIKEYEVQKNQLLGADPGSDIGELTDSIVAAPKYDSSNRKKRKVTAKVVTAIQTHLDANEKKRKNGQSKIQKKKIDIYEALVAEGFDISYSTVCNTIRKMQNQVAEAFIKARYELGDVCEFDSLEGSMNTCETFAQSLTLNPKSGVLFNWNMAYYSIDKYIHHIHSTNYGKNLIISM